jgi:SAM-dependent methyltransferase
MTSLDARSDPVIAPAPMLFALTIFASAALVFMVEPMVAKMMLPLLGGGPSIWNTSLAFFQGMLLAGYGYAHLLQMVRSLKVQVGVHLALLVLAGFVLPLHVADLFGPPDSGHPALWLLGALTASIGAPFAVLSATAPLAQAWHARTVHADTGAEPYVLYAASNLGSLIALVAYPALVEPLTPLHGQTLAWSVAYGVFVLLIGALGLLVIRRNGAQIEAQTVPELTTGVGPTATDRLIWVLLAAAPSSLMLGVTTFITTDVASAPFLWVIPLALYLLTFIIAFAAKPWISSETALVLQAAALAACTAILPFTGTSLAVALLVHLGSFFLTALICHQALVARRPDPAHLTEFYLWMSFGGVVGGAFNAFLAPVIFNSVWEYPLVLTLACLARPWGRGRFETWRWATLALGVAAALAAPALTPFIHNHNTAHLTLLFAQGPDAMKFLIKLAMAVAIVCAFVVRRRALAFFGLIAVISIAAEGAGDRIDVRASWRNFFGVVKESHMLIDGLGGDVKMLAHGTTLHGAQAQHPAYRCRPLLYYAPETPIGQVFKAVRAQRPAIRVGAVGLGTGAVAAYTRPSDRLTFFEIDPQVMRLATDPEHFSYTTECARGKIDYVVGDARLTLARQPLDIFDILLIDAFSSDSVPAHLLTVEAVRGYLTHLKPDGVLVLHLSNRNLDLPGPAMAVAHAAGGYAMVQKHKMSKDSPPLWESSEDAVIVGRSPQALAAYGSDPRWSPADPTLARAWTDDYTNLAGAMISRMKQRWAAKAD